MLSYCYVWFCFAGSLYLGFRVWNSHVTLPRAEHSLFVSFFGLAGLQDSGMCAATGNDRDCTKDIAPGLCI